MSNVSQWSTTANNNNSASPNGAPEGMAPSGVNDTIRENMSAVAKERADTDGTLITGGSSNAFTLTTSNSHAALGDQGNIICQMDRAATGAATLAVDGLAAKSIVINESEAVGSATWVADQIVEFTYNPTNDTYEVRGPSIPADGSISTAKLGDDSVTEAKVSTFPLPRSYLSGLQMANDSDANHDIAIAVGTCRGSANGSNLTLSSIMTKRVDASWAIGDNAGGLADGVSLSANQWLHMFLVDEDGGATDAGFDTSIIATNLLATSGVGSTFRRIGAVLTNSSSNILGFIQRGDRFLWKNPPLDMNTVAHTADAAQTTALSVPLGLSVTAIVNAKINSEAIWYISSPDVNDENSSVSAAPLGNLQAGGSGQDDAGQIMVDTDTSSQIRTVSNQSTNLELATIGWIDTRGRDD